MIARVNGTRLFYDITGSGEVPLVLVHGSWSSHRNWDLVVPGLAQRCRLVTYDRRGHSASGPATPDSVRDDVADLAGLVEWLGLAPAFVAGNSFGASIALRLAAERPDLLQGVIAHEPPLFRLLADDSRFAPMLAEIGRRISAVVQRIVDGDHSGAAEQFVETVALGPGSWAPLPPDIQRTMIENAPTFLHEANDPEALSLAVDAIRRFTRPVLLTMGEESPPAFEPIIRRLADTLPRATVATLKTGHIPQITRADLYVQTLTAFVSEQVAI